MLAGSVMADFSDIKSLGVDQFAEMLKNEGYDDCVVQKFVENQISGSIFLKLQEHHLKELVPVIGVRLSIGELLTKARKVRFTDAAVVQCRCWCGGELGSLSLLYLLKFIS